jgi:chemotaxis protein MotB
VTRRDRRAGTDRWLVSYADLVTLLLAFFASAYAVSDLNAARVKPAALAIRHALGQVETPQVAAGTPTAVVLPVRLADAPRIDPPAEPGSSPLPDRLRTVVADEIAGGRARVTTSHDDLVLSLPEAATYESGRAELHAGARRVLARFAELLVQTGLDARVEGHTDDVPISSPRFSSNWELSTARASGVVAVLVAQGVDPVRLSAAGYGQFHPKVPNVTAADRALNRRVDIVLVGGARVGGAVAPRMEHGTGSVGP